MSRRRSVASLLCVSTIALLLAGGTPPASGLSPNIVISQVYGGGGSTYANDFVEIFNRGSATLSLDGMSVQYAPATTSSWSVVRLAGPIASGRYTLVAFAGGSSGDPLPTPEYQSTTNLNSTTGKVALASTTSALECGSVEGDCTYPHLPIVDLLGYGTSANNFEAQRGPTLSPTTAATRLEAGCSETDDNSRDFEATTPAPRNSASPTHPCGTVPPAPVITSVQARDASVTVSFDPPADNGGSPIASYTATSSGSPAVSASAADSPITVSGLQNGTSYTFTVRATNGVGDSAESAPSDAVTPRTVPDPPTITGVTPGNASVTVAFDPPADDGGASVTSYTVTSSGGASVTGPSSPLTVTGLVNGTAYTFTARATNVAGDSAESAPSQSSTPRGVPSAPTAPRARPGSGEVVVSWLAPLSNGGSVVTGYVVKRLPDGPTQTVPAGVRAVAFAGLANGTLYQFSVAATNVAGTGPAAAVSATPIGGVTVSVAGAVVPEGNSGAHWAAFVVSLSGARSRDVAVSFATSDGTASAGSDYTATSARLTFVPGETRKVVLVRIAGDPTFERTETFSVTLSSAAGVVLGTASAVGTIVNDDAPPSVRVNDVSRAEGTGTSTPVAFTLTLSRASALPMSVKIATVDGTAKAPGDYAAVSRTVTIQAGSTSATVSVPVVADSVPEPDERFSLALSAPVNATIADASGTATLLNDD